ncbi:GNAT family N-acetyltransferase [Cellulomonas sp. Root137]|uniref:GNAT family N-acetyltransferase n=1 Tax=Cellulomonas sp. Root137 TaxID=1736459 RepID=UPI0007015D80|nr:GNAT family N-acetyltransferase [Cellulomonas sp. Root137]KQY44564.1 hypothetical protein ASD18_13765 [Cellulomonas sp. Root137]
MTGRIDASALSASLAQVQINVGFARAVVDDVVDGSVWVSADVGVGAAHVIHSYGMSLIWGERVDDAFEELVSRLVEGTYWTRDEWLQVDPRWAHLPWRERLGIDSVDEHVRVNFDFDRDQFLAGGVDTATSDSWTLRPATAADFARPGSVIPVEFWRNAEQFLANGGGWVAERDGAFGAMAFSSFRSGSQIELGIETAPDARRQGLATAVARRMITDTLLQGLTPVWSCRASNAGSYRLARTLGFVPVREIPYFRLGVRRPASRQGRIAMR